MRRRSMFRKRSFQRSVSFVLIGTILFGNFTTGLMADDKFGGVFRAIRRGLRNVDEVHHERVEPNARTQDQIEQLAGQLDWLEHHLEIYGSVVPKQPDIWGEARLTRHRQQVEEELAKRLGTFENTLQGSISRTDQSSLSFMMALGSIIGEGGKAPTTTINSSGVTANSDSGVPESEDNPAEPPRATSTITPSGLPGATHGDITVALEPTIHNDQLYRYLNALNTLRRLNEGDDTADAPGYALNLIRLPASVLPGRRTRQGYGAEVTYTIRPHLGDDLLPQTFKSLAINDQVDQLGLHIKRLLEDRNLEDDIGALTPLAAYVQAERSAQPIIQAFYDRLARLHQQIANLELYGPFSPDKRYFHFLNGRREYLRNRIVQLETAWRFANEFSSSDDEECKSEASNNAAEVQYNLGVLTIANRSICFKVKVKIERVRNAIFRLVQTGIAIIPGDVEVTFDEDKDPVKLELQFVVVEKDLVGGEAVPDDLPYEIFLPTIPKGFPTVSKAPREELQETAEDWKITDELVRWTLENPVHTAKGIAPGNNAKNAGAPATNTDTHPTPVENRNHEREQKDSNGEPKGKNRECAQDSTDSGNQDQHADQWGHQCWLKRRTEQRKSLVPTLVDWSDRNYREQIIEETSNAAQHNIVALFGAAATVAGELDEDLRRYIPFIDVESVASQAASTSQLLPIDGCELQDILRALEVVNQIALFIKQFPSQAAELENIARNARLPLAAKPLLGQLSTFASEVESWQELLKCNNSTDALGKILARIQAQSVSTALAKEFLQALDTTEKDEKEVELAGAFLQLLREYSSQEKKAELEKFLNQLNKENTKEFREQSLLAFAKDVKDAVDPKTLASIKESIKSMVHLVESTTGQDTNTDSALVNNLLSYLVSQEESRLEELKALIPCLLPVAQRMEIVSRLQPGLISPFDQRQSGNEDGSCPLPHLPVAPVAFQTVVAQPLTFGGIPSGNHSAPVATLPTSGSLKTKIPMTYRGQFSEHAQKFVGNAITSGIVFSSPSRNQGVAFPVAPSIVMDVYGHRAILEIGKMVQGVLAYSPPNTSPDKIMVDVRRILRDELTAAYRFLEQEQLLSCWEFGGPGLADAIRRRDTEGVRRIREQFYRRLPPGVEKSITGALGWALVIESALLNERLIEDMKQVADAKGCSIGDVQNLCFWGPNPPVESREAFKRYVDQKWPIQVFTVDPASQDQNISDSYSVTRELQIAAAVAAATGEVSLSTAAEFARSVQVDIDTIGLNRTAVGFTHGQNSFGWRYYPRLQSPGTTGLIGTIGQTIMGGPSRDSLIRQRMLEPGVRESVAVVVMPSFVQYVNVESRTSWFHLNDPADRELTVKDSMRLSSAQQAISNVLPCIADCGAYRPGDVGQLATVLEQLSSRLPFQQAKLQVPYENNSGGFQIFRSGVAGLSPELTGWYGAPGIDPNANTSIFLEGRGFNVHETRVIVGGRSVHFRLLSRDLMEITVPPGTQALGGGPRNDKRIDVHVATPYGVSDHLLVPLVNDSRAVTVDTQWKPGAHQFTGQVVKNSDGTIDKLQQVTMNPAQPLGVYVPMELKGGDHKIDLNFMLQTPKGLVALSQSVSDLSASYHASSSTYRVSPTGLTSLISTVKTVAETYLKDGTLPANSKRVTLLTEGTLKVGTNAYSVKGTMPITLELY